MQAHTFLLYVMWCLCILFSHSSRGCFIITCLMSESTFKPAQLWYLRWISPFLLILCLTASLSFHPPTGRMVHRAIKVIKANNSCLQVQVSSLRRVSGKTSWVGCAKNKVLIARCRAFYIFLPKGNVEKNGWTCPWISVKKKRNSLYYPLGNYKGGQGGKRETETTLLQKQLPSVMTFWKTLTLSCLRENVEQPEIKSREKKPTSWHSLAFPSYISNLYSVFNTCIENCISALQIL